MAQKANHNALKHGAFAEVIILPSEDPKEFDELLASLNDEWNPEGPSEKDKVLSIALGMWRKRRFRRNLEYEIGKIGVEESWYDHFRQKRTDMLLSLLEELESGGCITEENLSDKVGQIWADKIKKQLPRKNYDDDSAWRLGLRDLLTANIEKRLLSQPGRSVLDEELSDELFADKEQRLEERIDAKIDKDIKQLGQIKTMKAIGLGKRSAPVPIVSLTQFESPGNQAAESEQHNAKL
jgi:hypothetical protein